MHLPTLKIGASQFRIAGAERPRRLDLQEYWLAYFPSGTQCRAMEAELKSQR
jgi:hypothetical protein